MSAKRSGACIGKIQQARILVTGCYAQRAPEELAVLPGVAWVVGNSHKVQIPDIVNEQADTHYHGKFTSAISSRSTTFCPRRWRMPRAIARAPI